MAVYQKFEVVHCFFIFGIYTLNTRISAVSGITPCLYFFNALFANGFKATVKFLEQILSIDNKLH